MREGVSTVANDADLVRQLRIHQECWELLPWAVNGRLSSSDAATVGQHLKECTRCSQELHIQHQLCDAIRRDDPVLLAPQASLKKLWQRLEVDSQPHAAADCSHPGLHGPLAHTSLIQGGAQECVPAATVANASHPPPSQRRMQVALAAQAAIILALVGWMGWQTYERWQAPRYFTVTTRPEVVARQPAVRIVFVEGIPMQDVVDLLRLVDAQILAGPSQAGVFTLGLPSQSTQESAARTALQLSTDPRVQFAESIAPARESP